MTFNGVCKQIPVKKTFPDIILSPCFPVSNEIFVEVPVSSRAHLLPSYRLQDSSLARVWLELKFRQAQAGSAREITRLETSLRASQLVVNTIPATILEWIQGQDRILTRGK